MEIKVRNRDVIWSYLGSFFQYCTSLIILPIVLSNINKAELGLWYSFASIGTLVTYLDFGFSTTLVRNITYAWSGAASVRKKGFDTSDVKEKVNVDFIYQILTTCKLVCLVIAIIAGIVMYTAGIAYVQYIARDMNTADIAMYAWLIYAFGVFLNIYYNYWGNALRGIGLISQYQKIIIISRITQIILSYVGIKVGYGLIALSVSYVISGFIIRFLSKIFLQKELSRVSKEANYKSVKRSVKETVTKSWEMFKAVWYNAKRSGIISLCSYAINQSLTLICSAYLGIEETAAYGLCLQLITAIMSVAGILFSTYSPKMINSMALGKTVEYRKTFSMCIFVFWFIAIGGIVGFAIVCKPLLALINSNTVIPIPMFLFMGVYMFLEHNHGEYTAYYTMRNDICYLKSYIISGIAIVFFSWFFAIRGCDIYILMFVHCIVQLVYNNWKWPYSVNKEMNTTVFETIREGGQESLKLLGRLLHFNKA